MTREEAITILNMVEAHGLADEAKKVAIEALSQEPTTVIATGDGAYYKIKACEDAISREELLKAIDTWDRFGVDDTNSLFRLDNLSLPHYVAYIHYDDVVKCIKGLPSVAIPSAEPYKGMTNREVMDKLFPELSELFYDNVFTEDWWNSPYEPQESEDKE